MVLSKSFLVSLKVFCRKTPFFLDCEERLHVQSCSASSEYDENYDCNKVSDGTKLDSNSYWLTHYGTTSIWIQINFDSLYYIKKLKIKQTSNVDYRPKEIEINFSKDIRLHHVLPNTGNWNGVKVGRDIVSNFIKIRVKQANNRRNKYTGFKQIQAFGCLPGEQNTDEICV